MSQQLKFFDFDLGEWISPAITKTHNGARVVVEKLVYANWLYVALVCYPTAPVRIVEPVIGTSPEIALKMLEARCREYSPATVAAFSNPPAPPLKFQDVELEGDKYKCTQRGEFFVCSCEDGSCTISHWPSDHIIARYRPAPNESRQDALNRLAKIYKGSAFTASS